MGTLVERLVSALPAPWLRPHTAVTSIAGDASGPRWHVASTTHAKQPISESFDAVLLATPLDATRRLLAPLDAAAAELLPVESSSAVLVAFCYADASRVPVPPGFGFLVSPKFAAPDEEQDPSASLLLACTFVDQKFPHRVPPGGRQVRAFFGGAAADRRNRARASPCAHGRAPLAELTAAVCRRSPRPRR
jgi:oxygen-dependent protoporphyrinogen oxidase